MPKNIWIPFLAVLMAFSGAPRAQAANAPLEYRVKAAFLLNFAKFVEWPPQAFAGKHSPLVIGILGENPFEDALEETVRGQSLLSRAIEIKESRNLEELKSCHLLFISRSEENTAPEILKALRGTNALTVSEMEDFSKKGGMIQLVNKEDKVRFKINQKAAEKAGLKISARLLSLADRS